VALGPGRPDMTWHDLFLQSQLQQKLDNTLKALKVITPVGEKMATCDEPQAKHYASSFGIQC
jgi:hypothetical protein